MERAQRASNYPQWSADQRKAFDGTYKNLSLGGKIAVDMRNLSEPLAFQLHPELTGAEWFDVIQLYYLLHGMPDRTDPETTGRQVTALLPERLR